MKTIPRISWQDCGVFNLYILDNVKAQIKKNTGFNFSYFQFLFKSRITDP